MVFSLVVAFVVTPWAAVRLLGREHGHHDEAEDRLTRAYRRVMRPLIANPVRRLFALATVALLLLVSVAFVPLGWVTVKMLPFDNKSELQVMVRLPEDAPLETTAGVAAALADEALRDEAVTAVDLHRRSVPVYVQRPRAPLLPEAAGEPRGFAGNAGAEGRTP
jgi:multidrug efflux pump subunit AcrB